jgi:FkbM family methyltransferase
VYGKYEPFESNLVKRVVLPGMTVVNIGANIGYYTLIAAISAGETGKVISFEPSSENFALLRKNIADNFLRNVEPRNQAVSDERGMLKLFLSESNSGDHQIYAAEGDDRPAQEVEAVKLDDLVAEGIAPDVLIIDVQGAELKVLRGFRDYLSSLDRKPIVMLMEFGPRNLWQSGDSPEALLEYLAEMKLGFVVIDEAGRCVTNMSEADLVSSTPGYSEKNLLIFDAAQKQVFLDWLNA